MPKIGFVVSRLIFSWRNVEKGPLILSENTLLIALQAIYLQTKKTLTKDKGLPYHSII